MSEKHQGPIWKQFVQDLSAKGHQSPYLDRLRRPGTGETGQMTLEMEIIQEMASALGRSEDQLNYALLQLEVCGLELDRLERERASLAERDALVTKFNALRDQALDRLQNLTIHREAVGFRNNDILRELFPVPPARALR